MSLAKRLAVALVLFFTVSLTINQQPATIPNSDDLYWLALNMYHEAGNQSELGKAAVGIVTLNRLHHATMFKSTVQSVVKERKQFSWYHTKKNHAPINRDVWNECLRISELLLTNKYNRDIMNLLSKATHFHATYVKPNWRKTMVKVVQIDDHIFYRMKA